MTGRGKKSLEQLLELTAEWGRGKQARDGERGMSFVTSAIADVS
jgi:hypothetical protein